MSALVDGKKVRAYAVDTIKDTTHVSVERANAVRNRSRERFGRPLAEVEGEVFAPLNLENREKREKKLRSVGSL